MTAKRRLDAFSYGLGVEQETHTCADCGYTSANRKNFKRSGDGGSFTCSTGHYTSKEGEQKRQKNAYRETAMKRKGELQFEHLEHKSGTVHGFALDYDKGEVVAQMTITKPRAFIRPEEVDEVPTDITGQGRFPIRQEPSRVSWALATGAGRRSAAPHILAAALSEEYGLHPVADKTLSAAGARMSRSAVKRGLLRPHPDNPTMEANAGTMVGTENEARSSLMGAYEGAQMGQWSKPRYNERNQRISALDKFSSQQMSRATQRVFGNKNRKREREPEPVQGTLF